LLWALNKDGNLYQIKQEDLLDSENLSWRQIPNISNIKDITFGNEHLLLLNKDQ
jgi:hypothetical protein